MKAKLHFMLVILGWPGIWQSLASQELLIPATNDNTIYSESDSSNGKGNYLFTGLTAVGNERRALLKFDLAQIQPDDSVISASLRLYLSKTTSGNSSVGLFKMKRNWGEGVSHAKFEEGGGATPKPGDATWNYAFFDTARWGTTGGDHEDLASASYIVGAVIGTCTWTGDTLTSDIRRWINKPDSNFGWVLMIKEQEPPTSKRFNSRENAEFPPQLVVNISKPSAVIQSKENNLFVFPNPSSGVVYIHGNNLDLTKVRLLDLTGKEITTSDLEVQRISPAEMSFVIRRKGTYILDINHIFRKIIIL